MILSLLIKMLACSFILLGYYWLFLRNKRFHHYNRFYLLGITGLSIIIPFIRIPVFFESDTVTGQFVNRSIHIISVSKWEDEIVIPANAPGFWAWLNWQNALFILYSLVIVVLLYSLAKSLRYIRGLSRKYSFQQINSLKLYNTTEPGTPFSFFRSIFWNSRLDFNSKEGQQIFRHELFHVKQQHSADILFLEAICIFFWINPFFHLVKKEIKAIHEFLADQHAVKNHNQNEYAELLVLQTLTAKQSRISNYFFQNHIKRRIAMITQFKSKKYSYWTRLLALPLSVLLFCGIALHAKTNEVPVRNANSHKTSHNAVIAPLTVIIDAGHGGADAGAKAKNGLNEKDLSLAIARQIKEQAKSYNLNIVMTREEDVMPTLRERSGMVESAKADLLISIHVAASETENSNHGFEIYITKKNQSTLAKSKILGMHVADQLETVYEVAPIKQRTEKGIWILDAVPCPAVLIECGYLTSDKDLDFITKPENQAKIARNILLGVTEYQARNVAANKTDTVPDNIIINDTSDVKLSEAQLKKQMAQLKLAEAKLMELQARQRALEQKQQQMEIAQRKQADARLKDMELHQKALQQKQREMEVKQRKLAEERSAYQEQNQKGLKRKQQQIDLHQQQLAKKQLAEIEHQQKAFEQKRQQLELVQNKMAEEKFAALEAEQRSRLQKKQELEIMQQKLAEARLADIEHTEKAMRQKQGELAMTQQKMAEARAANLHNEQKAMLEKQKELALSKRKIEEAKIMEMEAQEKARIQEEVEKLQSEISARNDEARLRQDSEPLFTKVEVRPQYPGGAQGWQRYLVKNLRYPVKARDKEITGTVVVQFIVEKDGKVSDVNAIKGPAELRDESVKLIRESGNWIPAKQNGLVVRALHQQSIEYKIAKSVNR